MMQRAVLTTATIAVLLAMGCAAPTTRDRPFTDDWAYVSQNESKAPKVGGPIPLSDGTGGLPPANIHIDDQGKPALRLGENSRWHPEVGFNSGSPRVGLKYEREF